MYICQLSVIQPLERYDKYLTSDTTPPLYISLLHTNALTQTLNRSN